MALENPHGNLNAHWLVHVPEQRQDEFKKAVLLWLETAAGEILDKGAIRFDAPYNTRGLARYMLKGVHPGVAPFYGVRAEPQGFVRGKRSGFSRNIGPTQKRILREDGKYPEAKRRIFPFSPTKQQNVSGAPS